MFSLEEADEIARCLALEELNANGMPDLFLPKVREIAESDPSPVCRELAGTLLFLESKKGEMENLARGFETTPQGFHELFDQAPSPFRKALLRVAWKAPSRELLNIWRDQLLTEEIPEIQAIGLSLLSASGAPADAGLSLAFLGSDSSDVVKAAIDLLFHQDSALLKQHLASPLSHANLDIRFHAIRRLASLDSREALNYLNHAIEGDDSLARRRAIQELSLIPLQEAEPSYIRVLGLENQPLLLAMAGIALASRPKIDLPPHIFDMLLLSKGLKKHLLDIILRHVVQGIKSAGILSGSIEEYLESLKQELQARRTDLAIALAMRDLRHADLEIRRQAVEKLTRFAGDPRVQKSLRTRLKNESDEELKGKMQSMLEDAPVEAQEKPAQNLEAALASGTFFGLPAREQALLLGSVSALDQFNASKTGFLSVFEKSREKAVLIKALKLFEAFGKASDAEALLPLLKSEDPSVVGNTLRTIARLDFDKIAMVINPLLREENLAVKAAALEVFIDCDKEGALQYLKSMLGSPVNAVRRKALTIAPLIDFASIEPILVSILKKDPHPDIQAQAGFLIASNPTEAGLKTLYLHTHPQKVQPGPDLTELWEATRPAAARFFAQEPEKIDSWLEAALASERSEPSGSEPSYAFHKVAGQSGARSTQTPPIDWSGIVFNPRNLDAVGIFAILFFVLSLATNPSWSSTGFYRKDSSPTPAPPPIETKPPERVASAPHANPPVIGWTVIEGNWLQDVSLNPAASPSAATK